MGQYIFIVALARKAEVSSINYDDLLMWSSLTFWEICLFFLAELALA